MFFAGLFAMYFSLRANSPEIWAHDTAILNVPFALVNTIILVASSFTAQFGVFAAERMQPRATGLSPVKWGMVEWFDETCGQLLKRLEEPPAGTIFLLVAHSAGRLLPTIRSRCRVLRFSALEDADVRAVLRGALPDASSAELEALIAVGQGSPGRALRFAGLDLAGLDAALQDLARQGDAQNVRRLALAQQLSGKAAQARYEAFLQRVPSFIASVARQRSGDALKQALDQWEKARNLAAIAVPTSLEVQNTVFTLAGHVAALAQNGTSAKA